MAIWDNWLDRLAVSIAGRLNDGMAKQYGVLGRYYAGDHKPQLKKKGKQDDNIILNFVGLAINRSVSRLWRGGVDFNLPDGTQQIEVNGEKQTKKSEQQEYIDNLWDLNKKEIILYQVGLHGSVYGTSYFKIIPEGLIDPYTGDLYPRLIALDPEIVRIETDPQDMNIVDKYIVEYTTVEKVDEFHTREKSYKEVTRRDRDTDYEEGEAMGFWVVVYYEKVGDTQWVEVAREQWPYDFPPIIHWKNLPSLKSCYGDSDIDDAINVQDKENFTVSNIGKIIKFHAHPKTIGIGFNAGELKAKDDVESFWTVSNPDAQVFNLEMQSDLVSSRQFALDLRQSVFDISREVDISSMADRLGALTNFGLHVLYSDALDKNDTKRQLYGDALLELNRRLLVLDGHEKEASRPGELQWGNALIMNVKEEIEVDQMALEMKIVDKETIVQRYKERYGLDYETLLKRLEDEAQTENANNSDIGSLILRNFSQGR